MYSYECLRKKLFFTQLNLDTLQYLLDHKKLDASQPITMKQLVQVGYIGKVRDGIVLLARVSFYLYFFYKKKFKFIFKKRDHLISHRVLPFK